VRGDDQQRRVQHRSSSGERNGLSKIFSVSESGHFTGFSAQTEEAQDYQYDHDDTDDVENVHCHGSLVKNCYKST
jgi:hypothetical protein